MKKPFIAANWKMNTILSEATTLVNNLKDNLSNLEQKEVVLCPPFIYLPAVRNILKNSNIKIGAQNVYFQPKGAFTGEISTSMLKDIGCAYVIIGHSERRHIFMEDNELINKKIKAVLTADLLPIFCVGELLEERTNNATEKVIRSQIENGLDDIPVDKYNQLIIAYEPVWAIGTGKNATPEQAQEIHSFIRKLMAHLSNDVIAREIPIIYGGSVNPDNIQLLMSGEDIDGALVGGASLSADSFTKIVNGVKKP
jgi:triosephosphate isomerase (TIM)